MKIMDTTEMSEMNDYEYGKYMVLDTIKYMAYAMVIYAVPIGLYWITR